MWCVFSLYLHFHCVVTSSFMMQTLVKSLDDVTEYPPSLLSCIETSYNAHHKPHVCLISVGGALILSWQETLQHQVGPNLDNSSLSCPSRSGVRGKRYGYKWMNGHMNGRVVLLIDEWSYEWMSSFINRWMVIWMDE